jgi:hypothetical protein
MLAFLCSQNLSVSSVPWWMFRQQMGRQKTNRAERGHGWCLPCQAAISGANSEDQPERLSRLFSFLIALKQGDRVTARG